jgi:hypothetical protein
MLLLCGVFLFLVLAPLLAPLPVFAATPIRLSITAETSSGIEQEIIDQITNQLSNDSDVIVSNVNPEWYVVCHIIQNLDPRSGQIRYNGSVMIKTGDGQIIGMVSCQKYNQDFAPEQYDQMNINGPPLNKQLVDSAARETIRMVAQRATERIETAVPVEIKTRDQIAQAKSLANSGKYKEAIAVLNTIGPDSVHYKGAQQSIAQLKKKQLSYTPKRKPQ